MESMLLMLGNQVMAIVLMLGGLGLGLLVPFRRISTKNSPPQQPEQTIYISVPTPITAAASTPRTHSYPSSHAPSVPQSYPGTPKANRHVMGRPAGPVAFAEGVSETGADGSIHFPPPTYQPYY